MILRRLGYFRAPEYSPIDDVQLMQVFKRQQKFSTVKSASLLIETLLALQMVEQFSSIDEPARRWKSVENHNK